VKPNADRNNAALVRAKEKGRWRSGRAIKAGFLVALLLVAGFLSDWYWFGRTSKSLPAPVDPRSHSAGSAQNFDALKLRLGTLAPRGSSNYNSLRTMAESWRNETSGTVDLVIYPGGSRGEAELVRLMKTNQLQAALLISVGLAEIEPALTCLQTVPMEFRDLAEVDFVLEKLRPMLEDRLERKGFVVLSWRSCGWVRLFAKNPVLHPDDVKKLKLFTWARDPSLVEIYQSAGFNPVKLEVADLRPGLQTGMVDAAFVPPVFAVVMQLDAVAPYMLELNWVPLIAALIMRQDAWEGIPAEVRSRLLVAATTAGAEIKTAGLKEMDYGLSAMVKRGLNVTANTPEIEAEWRACASTLQPKIRGQIVPDDICDFVTRQVTEFRLMNRSGGREEANP